MKKSVRYLAITALILSIVINYGCPGIFGYNIVGTWSVTATFGPGDTEDYTMSFAGDKKTGTVTWTAFGYSLTGTYTVSGKNVDFEVSDSGEMETFTGVFDNKDTMSGTGILTFFEAAASDFRKMKRRQARAVLEDSYNFTWTGTKI